MNELWSNSIELMLLGMGSVFSFLALLVMGVTTMSALINRFSPQITHLNKANQSKAALVETEVAAVAAAAWVTARAPSSKPAKKL
jgi:oxaloacetate decarboxylase gamma subunit